LLAERFDFLHLPQAAPRGAEPSDPRVEAAVREYLERVDPVDVQEFLARYALDLLR
jgi:hypothetical protein